MLTLKCALQQIAYKRLTFSLSVYVYMSISNLMPADAYWSTNYDLLFSQQGARDCLGRTITRVWLSWMPEVAERQTPNHITFTAGIHSQSG